VDVVFGTHNMGVLPVLLDRSRHNHEAQVEILDALEVFPSTLLPTRRESVYAAWISISVGCNNTCTSCIVPQQRGKETDRLPHDAFSVRRTRAGDLWQNRGVRGEDDQRRGTGIPAGGNRPVALGMRTLGPR
jgi:tRNA-2-methylthio-N6-dimethylallyladenosine synthase